MRKFYVIILVFALFISCSKQSSSSTDDKQASLTVNLTNGKSYELDEFNSRFLYVEGGFDNNLQVYYYSLAAVMQSMDVVLYLSIPTGNRVLSPGTYTDENKPGSSISISGTSYGEENISKVVITKVDDNKYVSGTFTATIKNSNTPLAVGEFKNIKIK